MKVEVELLTSFLDAISEGIVVLVGVVWQPKKNRSGASALLLREGPRLLLREMGQD